MSQANKRSNSQTKSVGAEGHSSGPLYSAKWTRVRVRVRVRVRARMLMLGEGNEEVLAGMHGPAYICVYSACMYVRVHNNNNKNKNNNNNSNK